MIIDFELNEVVDIDDPLSLNHECTGIITEVLPDGIFKVEFCDGTHSYHEREYLNQSRNE